jgi:hypothetical protein
MTTRHEPQRIDQFGDHYPVIAERPQVDIPPGLPVTRPFFAKIHAPERKSASRSRAPGFPPGRPPGKEPPSPRLKSRSFRRTSPARARLTTSPARLAGATDSAASTQRRGQGRASRCRGSARLIACTCQVPGTAVGMCLRSRCFLAGARLRKGGHAA